MIWLGPTRPSEIRAHVLSIFGGVALLDGDIYCGQDDSAKIDELHMGMARQRGIYQSKQDLSIEDLITPCARERLTSLRDMHQSSMKKTMSSVYVGDLAPSQAYLRGGVWLPTVTRTSSLVSLSKSHFLTPNEIAFSMGFPSVPVAASLYGDAIPKGLRNLNSKEARHLSGNGVMLQQATAWMLYILAHTLRREVVEGWKPELSFGQASRDDVDEDEETD